MASKTFAHVTPEVLRWARESIGYSIQDAAEKMGVPWYRLAGAEEGADLLTLRQAEDAARTYERPLAALFLPSPPIEEPQEVKFRRLPGSPEPPWPPAMQLLARRITERQDAAVELYESLDEAPVWATTRTAFAHGDRHDLPELARQVLAVGRDDQRHWSDVYAPLRGWRDAVEALGVLVMQDGSMEVDDMRGFASIRPEAVPAIVVNTNDDARARAFTIVHEFGHVILAARGQPVGPGAEAWCDQFAGEVLMPPAWLAAEFESAAASTLLGRVEEVARTFSVTPLAAAVRIARSKLADQREVDAVITEIRRRGEGVSKPRGGGDYYVKTIAGLGPGYISLVLSALEANTVTYPTASALLGGVKANHLDELRDRVAGRP